MARLRKLRDWAIAGGPHYENPIRVFWYGESLAKEFQTRRFRVKIKDINSGDWIEHERMIDEKIPNPGSLGLWKRIGREGDFWIYTTDKS
jgi:hypothetical protein